VGDTASIQRSNVRDWLALIRLPQMLAVAAAPLAGAVIAGAGWPQAHMILALMAGSAALWAGGSVLGDWASVNDDRIRRPERPLPAGRIRRWQALTVGIGLLVAGGTFAATPNPACSQIGLVLIVTVCLTRILLRGLPGQYVLDGVYYSFNLLLGMAMVPLAASPAQVGLRVYLLVAAGVYALGVVLLEQSDVHRYRARPLAAIALAIASASVAVAALPILMRPAATCLAGMVWTTLLLAAVGYRLTQAVLTPTGLTVSRALQTTTLGGVLLCAATVAYMCHPWWSLVVAVLVVPVAWSEWYLRAVRTTKTQGYEGT
jgi:4-hydroxybenzoate polyprenyltransferase